MGAVWRARDTKLNRDVAIKVLPAEFADAEERLARFEREARLLAALNHPNVAAIYGLEIFDETPHLVLECVEGETLAERLAAGALPVPEALNICRQVALALEAAHEAGVIHRDLKPGNVKVRPDGSVKVLDFGLAKFVEPEPETPSLTQSPTVTSGGTHTGVILGTAAYMSPEQARGRPLDKRTDVFSFGCVLYECLTGQQAFRGETVSDTLAAILKTEPDWDALPPETPAKVRDLLRRCLEKTRERRLHDIADARLEIEEALAMPAEGPAVAPSPPRRGRKGQVIGGIGLGLLAGAIGGFFLSRASAPRSARGSLTAVHSVIPLPAETRLRAHFMVPSMVFSPDGRKLVFHAVRDRVMQLYVRDLGRDDSMPIPGTEGAFDPFFSPDGEWLAFFAGSQLRKVALSGGSPAVLADAPPVSTGGTWAPDGSIFFAPLPNAGLARLAPGAKAWEFFTQPDATRGERALVFPQMLPDGENILVVVRAGRDFDDIATSNVAVHSLKTGKRRVLVEGALFARYVQPGYLLFTKGTILFAASCDPRKWVLTGPPAPLVKDLLTSSSDGQPYMAVSDNGLLVYASGQAVPSPSDTLVWVDRAGREESLALSGYHLYGPRLSPEGKRLAIVCQRTDSQRAFISIHELARGVLSPLTPEPGRHFSPTWSPDGRRLAFSTFEAAEPRLSWKPADGSGQMESLSPSGVPEFPNSWSPDGRTLLYTIARGLRSAENTDLWLLSLDGKRGRKAWIAGPAREMAAFFSPDGRAVTYVSNESGRNEVYVQPYPGPGPKIKVSTDGGAEPAWSPGGREIFYRSAESLMVAAIQTQPELAVGTAQILIPDRYERRADNEAVSRNYDVSADGKRFLFIKAGQVKEVPITQLNLITNWPAELPGLQTGRK